MFAYTLITVIILVLVVGVDSAIRQENNIFSLVSRRLAGDKYVARGALLTPAEKIFFYSLVTFAKSNGLTVVMKVRAADLIEPRKTLTKNEWWKRFRFLSQKHIDFVLLDLDMKPVIAIELNDRSHLEKERALRDVELMNAFLNASFPILFVPARSRYNQVLLSQAIVRELNRFARPIKQKARAITQA